MALRHPTLERSEAISLAWGQSPGDCRVAAGRFPASCLTRHSGAPDRYVPVYRPRNDSCLELK